MEGITPEAAARLARYRRDHRETDISPPIAGHWYWEAWKHAPGDEYSGEATHGGTADELLDKLDRG